MFTTLFGLSRISGILAHITEYVETCLPETSDSLGILQTLLSAKASKESNYKYTKENDGEKIPEILGSVLSMVCTDINPKINGDLSAIYKN